MLIHISVISTSRNNATSYRLQPSSDINYNQSLPLPTNEDLIDRMPRLQSLVPRIRRMAKYILGEIFLDLVIFDNFIELKVSNKNLPIDTTLQPRLQSFLGWVRLFDAEESAVS